MVTTKKKNYKNKNIQRSHWNPWLIESTYLNKHVARYEIRLPYSKDPSNTKRNLIAPSLGARKGFFHAISCRFCGK